MKLVVLSRNPRGHSVKRLRAVARDRGHQIRVLDTLDFTMSVESRNPGLVYRNRGLGKVDAVIPRIGASITGFGCAVVRQFEQMGVFTLNSSHAISTARDKLRSMQILSRHDVAIPPTAFVRSKAEVMPAIQRVGGAPVIIKLLEGSQGVGVILAETSKTAEAIIETLHSAKQNVLVQKFVAESRGRDVRAIVVGGRVVAAMRRVAVGGEFRSNVHRGGNTEGIQLDESYEKAAVKAAQIMGLRFAGVDILESDTGPQIMEVNSSPGLEGIEKATGVDVTGKMIELIEEQVLFPDIDLRQRLTLKSGYGVAEFVVDKQSELAGKTIAQTELRNREILVVNIDRNGVVIPAPHGNQEIKSGDRLLCFGKLLTLKSLVPKRKKKKNGSSAK